MEISNFKGFKKEIRRLDLFSQYAIYQIDDDVVQEKVSTTTPVNQVQNLSTEFEELPDIQKGERIAVNVRDTSKNTIEQSGILEKDEDGIFVAVSGNLSTNTITFILSANTIF